MASMAQTSSSTSVAARQIGYVIAILVNLALWYGVNVWPGWEAVPFLTDDTRQIVGLVNLSLAAGVVANVVNLGSRRPWVRPFGDMLLTAIGLAAAVRIWQVFPFEFGDSPVDWASVARVVLVVSIVGAAIGTVVQFVMLIVRIVKA